MNARRCERCRGFLREDNDGDLMHHAEIDCILFTIQEGLHNIEKTVYTALTGKTRV